MATHSSVLAWRVQGMEEPGGLPSMGSHRVGHNWSDLATAAAYEGTFFLSRLYWSEPPRFSPLTTPLQLFSRPTNKSSNFRLPFWEDFHLQASLGSLPIINISPFFLTTLPPLEYDLKKKKKNCQLPQLSYFLSVLIDCPSVCHSPCEATFVIFLSGLVMSACGCLWFALVLKLLELGAEGSWSSIWWSMIFTWISVDLLLWNEKKQQ